MPSVLETEAARVGMILFLCLLGAVAAIGVRALIESIGDAKHTRYERVDVSPQSVSPRHE
jgi:hypothetical protein